MNELKQLEKLEATSAKISKILQKEYEVDPFVADELSLYFLSNNFQAMEKVAQKKAMRKRFWQEHSPSKYWNKYWTWRYRKDYAFETVSIIILVVAILFGGIGYGIYATRPTFPYHGVVAEDYRMVGRYSSNQCLPSGGICVPTGSEGSFDYQIEHLKEGESVEMQGREGRKITLTKKNKQVIFREE